MTCTVPVATKRDDHSWSGTDTTAGTGAPNTVATRSLTACAPVCTPAAVVGTDAGRWYITATTYRSSGPANPTVLVTQCFAPPSGSMDQPSLLPGCWSGPAPHTPHRCTGPTFRIPSTR